MRDISIIIISDTESAESRDMVKAIQDSGLNVGEIVPVQRVRGILSGIRATPAVGVIYWAADLQEAQSDVAAFKSFIEHEDDIKAALNLLGIETEADADG